jgi:hypothetical protein
VIGELALCGNLKKLFKINKFLAFSGFFFRRKIFLHKSDQLFGNTYCKLIFKKNLDLIYLLIHKNECFVFKFQKSFIQGKMTFFKCFKIYIII